MRTHILISILLGATAAVTAQSLPPDIDKESFSRLPPLKRDQLSDKEKQAYDQIAGGTGKSVPAAGPAGFGIYSPRMYEPMRNLLDYFRTDTVLGPRSTELAILVASREVDEQYVWSNHEPLALKAGVAQNIIDVVKNGKDTAGLDEKDATLIRFGRELFREKKMSSEMFAKTVADFGRQGMVELTVLMSDYQLNHMMLKVADQHMPTGRKALLPIH